METTLFLHSGVTSVLRKVYTHGFYAEIGKDLHAGGGGERCV